MHVMEGDEQERTQLPIRFGYCLMQDLGKVRGKYVYTWQEGEYEDVYVDLPIRASSLHKQILPKNKWNVEQHSKRIFSNCHVVKTYLAQSAGAVIYTNCISAES